MYDYAAINIIITEHAAQFSEDISTCLVAICLLLHFVR